MKKNKLEIDNIIDFSLIGLTTTVKPYKLAWEINQKLEIDLSRQPDYILPNKNGEDCAYTYYLFYTSLSMLRLFRNKPNEPTSSKWLLVPEHPHFDYIIMIKSEHDDYGKRLHSVIKNIPTIELSAFLPLPALKSKENFIF